MAKPLQPSKTLAVNMFWLLLATAHTLSWSLFIPFKYSECFKGARTALKYCTQTFMCMLYQTVSAIFNWDAWRTWSIHCNPQRLWPFWFLLATAHMVSWSPLIPCKYSECFKGARTALKCCTQIWIIFECVATCSPELLDGNTWGAHGMFSAAYKRAVTWRR